MPCLRIVPQIALLVLCICIPFTRAEDSTSKLGANLKPWMECIQGNQQAYTISGKGSPKIDGKPQSIELRIQRFDAENFDFQIQHPEYSAEIRRRADAIAFCVPKFKIVYLGQGEAPAEDHLKPDGLLQRLTSPGTKPAGLVSLLLKNKAEVLAGLLVSFAGIKESENGQWQIDKKSHFTFQNDGKDVSAVIDESPLRLSLSFDSATPKAFDDWPGMAVRKLERVEIEKQLTRGVRRALEVLVPSTTAKESPKKVEHGELRYVEGQRVVLLDGTPEEIGTAHGKLLKREAMRCIDSVVYAFGTAQTVATGRWFREDLEAAYAKLAPHIPERHKAETRALAISLGVDEKLMQTVNVFPELFHCSGFALFGKATKDGKLYHGRVLDYMTTIGLQDAATTFIVAPNGMIPFANVGYAGFIGSVSGMNLEKISLGEMGGRGEGKWDGVPMATLMRRGLEECSSLEQVKKLWQDNPRTCEYFYVFADGENRTAVGVKATPENVEFVLPGEGHELLGTGIPDSVVLSAGSRLEELRKRVLNGYGKFDAESSQKLMCRPVAMNSNLHNVLFVPEDGIFYVANASHSEPAADRPYVKLDLNEMLHSMQRTTKPGSSLQTNAILQAKDTLAVGDEPSADARACLAGLAWEPASFEVTLEKADKDRGDWLVRFPSPKPSGNEANDRVAMEWYMAKDKQGNPLQAPAAVIVHESGSNMVVGRLIARALGNQGVHAFMIQLPFYGKRRVGERPSGDAVVGALQQGIADVRRARDAVAAFSVVDQNRISLQGTSLGGFVTATTAGLDHSFHRVIIFLAGGDLYSVVMNGQNEAAKMREELEKAGMDEAKVKSILSTIEPLRLAHRVEADRTWLFTGKYDQVVPPRNSALFADASKLEKSHHIEMMADHYSGALLLPEVIKQMREIMTLE